MKQFIIEIGQMNLGMQLIIGFWAVCLVLFTISSVMCMVTIAKHYVTDLFLTPKEA